MSFHILQKINETYKEISEPDDSVRIAFVFYNLYEQNKCKIFTRAKLEEDYLIKCAETFWAEVCDKRKRRLYKTCKKAFIFGKLVDLPDKNLKCAEIIQYDCKINEGSFLPEIKKLNISNKQLKSILFTLNKPYSRFWTNFTFAFSSDEGFESEDEIKSTEKLKDIPMHVKETIKSLENRSDSDILTRSISEPFKINNSVTSKDVLVMENKTTNYQSLTNEFKTEKLNSMHLAQLNYNKFCAKFNDPLWPVVKETATKFIVKQFGLAYGDWKTDRHLWTYCCHGFEPRIARICSCFVNVDPKTLYTIEEVCIICKIN
jgi:hypothetical protein